MPPRNVEEVLKWAREWAITRADVRGVLLVGSQARNEARADSDIDLVIIVEEKRAYLEELAWLDGLGPRVSFTREEWGVCTSLRVLLPNQLEVELGLVPSEWSRPHPVDPGTERVVRDGARSLYDPRGELERLIARVRLSKTEGA